MRRSWRRIARGFAISVAVTAAVVLYTELTGSRAGAQAILFFGILVAAWSGGFRAGLLGTLISSVIVVYNYTPPYGRLDIESGQFDHVLTFVLTGVVASAFSLWGRSAERSVARTRDQLRSLHQNAAALLEARDPDEMARVAVQEGIRALGAASGLVAAHRERANAFELLGVVSMNDNEREYWRTSWPPSSTPAANAFFLQRSIFIRDPASLTRQYPAFSALPTGSKGALAAVPLTVRNRRYGVLCLCFDGAHRFAPNEIELIRTLTNQAAQAFDRADLLASVGRQAEQFRVLAEASLAFSELELDAAAALDQLAGVCAARVADFVAVYRLSANRSRLDLAAARDTDGERLRCRQAACRVLAVADTITGSVAASGTSRFLPQFPAERLPELFPAGSGCLPPEELVDVLSLPIAAHGQVLGVVTLARPSSNGFAGPQIELAREVTRRAGLALLAAEERHGAQRELALRRRVEEDLREHQRKLNEALAAKDEFLGLVSHELRTPLTTIRGNADILRRRPDLPDDVRSQAIYDIAAESERLNRIIENMLYLARLEAGKRPELEPVLLHHVVTHATADFCRQMPKADVRLGDIDRDLIVEGNEEYIQQILQNVLSNAVKYSPPGSTIEVEVSRSGSNAVISVADRGIGINQHDASRLFEPFFRDTIEGRHISGLGIGLAVCKRLAEAQRGTMEARPREGGGSVFSLLLPVWEEEGNVAL
ncbi:MAG TPA: ATP-binding protein [Dehalococcoidia bacterium]|nr:ATP-binding protein [Dehalococcoidia bacterium]